MLRRSIPRHCMEKHTEEIVNASSCVDDIKGIYRVRKYTHGGVGYPCHVKKIFRPSSNEEFVLECEEQSCMDILNVAWSSGFNIR